eukprot:UN18228
MAHISKYSKYPKEDETMLDSEYCVFKVVHVKKTEHEGYPLTIISLKNDFETVDYLMDNNFFGEVSWCLKDETYVKKIIMYHKYKTEFGGEPINNKLIGKNSEKYGKQSGDTYYYIFYR